MGRRSSGPRGGSAGPHRDELEGFLTGLRHRLAARRAAGAPVPEIERNVEVAAIALAAGDLALAETELLGASDRLDALEPDPELREFPRGLVAYDAGADRGAPTPEADDAVRNRLLLVERLIAVAASEGVGVSAVESRLRKAQTALEDGDRRAAESLGSSALDELDRLRAERPRRGPA